MQSQSDKVLVWLLVALWFIIRGDLLYVFPCVILFLCFSVLLVLRLPRLGKRDLILVLFVRLFGLCLFRCVGFLFLLGSGKRCGLWLWHSLDFSLPFFESEHRLCYACALNVLFIIVDTHALLSVFVVLAKSQRLFMWPAKIDQTERLSWLICVITECTRNCVAVSMPLLNYQYWDAHYCHSCQMLFNVFVGG